MISTGWKPTGPNVNQALAPFTRAPGDEHRDHRAANDDGQEARDEPPPRLVGHPAGDEEGDGAEHHPQRLAAEVRPARAVDEQRRDRRGRQHHDEAEHREDRHDGDQHVVVDRRRAAVADAPWPGWTAGCRDLACVGPGGARGASPCARWSCVRSRRLRAGDQLAGRPGRSRRPARRSPSTSRSWRNPATAAPRRPARARRLASATASSIDSARDHRAHPGERVGHLAGRVADGHDGAHAARLDGHRPEVEALVAATGDQHDVLEGEHRGAARRAASSPSSRRSTTPRQHGRPARSDGGPPRRRPRRVRTPSTDPTPASSTVAAAANVFVRSWGSRRRRSATSTIDPAGPIS